MNKSERLADTNLIDKCQAEHKFSAIIFRLLTENDDLMVFACIKACWTGNLGSMSCIDFGTPCIITKTQLNNIGAWVFKKCHEISWFL